MLQDNFPHIWALAHGTISGRFSEWPRLAPEARAMLAMLDELEKEVNTAYTKGFEDATPQR